MATERRSQFNWIWIYSVLVLVSLIALSWGVLSGKPQQVPELPVQAEVTEPARDLLLKFLDDEAVLDQRWQEQALKWPDVQGVSDQTLKMSASTWPVLLRDMELFVRQSRPVLSTAQIRKLRDAFEPHEGFRNAELRPLVKDFGQRLEALLAHQKDQGAEQLVLTWQNTPDVVEQLVRIQDLVRELRKFSRSKAAPGEPRLSNALFSQMSVTFPTAAVRDFQATANRLLQSRWTLLYQLEKNRPPSPPPVIMPNAGGSDNLTGWAMVAMAIAGLVGTLFLAVSRRLLIQAQTRSAQRGQALQELQARWAQHEEASARQQQDRQSNAQMLAQLNRDLAEIQGRVKTAQLRFDSGQMLDLSSEELALVDEKLAHWLRVLSPVVHSGASGERDV